jgi:hypothetical protein
MLSVESWKCLMVALKNGSINVAILEYILLVVAHLDVAMKMRNLIFFVPLTQYLVKSVVPLLRRW